MEKVKQTLHALWDKTGGWKTVIGVVGWVFCKVEPSIIAQIPFVTPDQVLAFFQGLTGIGVADKLNRLLLALQSLKKDAAVVQADAQKIADIVKEPVNK